MELNKLMDLPVSVWLVRIPSSAGDGITKFPSIRAELVRSSEHLQRCGFRSIEIERLPRVLRTGIDVDDPVHVIWVSGFDKAWEYGGFPKVTLALDWQKINRTYIEVSADLPAEEVEAFSRSYPTTLKSQDGTKLYLSRLPPDDPRLNTPYEWQYARWIPGSPFDALKAVLIFARPQDDRIVSLTIEDMKRSLAR